MMQEFEASNTGAQSSDADPQSPGAKALKGGKGMSHLELLVAYREQGRQLEVTQAARLKDLETITELRAKAAQHLEMFHSLKSEGTTLRQKVRELEGLVLESKERERLAQKQLEIARRETAFETTRREWAVKEAGFCASALHHDNNEFRNEALRTTFESIAGFDEELLLEAHLEVKNTGESIVERFANTSVMMPSKDVDGFGVKKSMAISASAPHLQSCDAKVPFGSRKSVALSLPSAFVQDKSLDMDSVDELYRSMADWDLTPLSPFEGGSGLTGEFNKNAMRSKRGSLQRRGTVTKVGESGKRGSSSKESSKLTPKRASRKSTSSSLGSSRGSMDRSSVSLESTMSSTPGFDAG